METLSARQVNAEATAARATRKVVRTEDPGSLSRDRKEIEADFADRDQ